MAQSASTCLKSDGGCLCFWADGGCQCQFPAAGWRTGLTLMCGGQAAVASEFNGNFVQEVAWLEAKVGRVDAGVQLDGGVIITPMLANNAVTPQKLANATIGPTQVADGVINRTHLAGGGVPVYAFNSNCSTAGDATFDTTCNYQSRSCGGNCGTGGVKYRQCDGTCPADGQFQFCVAQSCTGNNVLKGYLIP